MNGDNYASRDSGRSREQHGSRYDRDDRRDRDRDRNRDRGDRRRSRSPHHRSSRREHDDSYSSSRDYRAREREDRYDSGRRDDRDWNRDRGQRRRDDDRPPRRDRDLFDDRRGGGGGGRGGRDRGGGGREDRDEFAAQARGKKDNSPPPKKREPTPDLTDVIPITERKRRMTQWDIKPPGYENVTAEQAKMSGMFPLPGAPRQQQMDPSRLQAFMNQPAGSAANTALKPSNARQSKRLFVYHLPASVTEDGLLQFFNLQLNGLNVIKGSDPCIQANIAEDRSFALVEFKTPSDATVALAMDGITMEEHHSEMNGNGDATPKGLEIKRPKDYIVPSADEDAYTEGEISSEVPDTANKLAITNLPPFLTDDQVLELLKAFGELKAFVLVRDADAPESRGIAFCEYADPAVTAVAVEGLNGMDLAGNAIKVTHASLGFTQASGLEMGVNAMSMFAGTTSDNLEEGRVLQLLNMTTPEELLDNDDYEEICEDVQEECQKYGKILSMKIPRPSGGSRQSAGVGKIFIKYEDKESAKKALQALAGRKFADRTVVTTYYDEASFDVSAW
ncbi:U2AF domain-containing protein kinase 1 [Exophiala viscosa]|uniref:Splicing factor U2AF subunit n=1 Tax=Exophiala viscosa TaxID=2486360 RepID=A0AAN6DUU5_9EURO|nr:U2AF domain-containing protein kinase 1 [Exophiala viscosa]KAI1623520.1 U2AF domain-containing protein kinase 1 [Exophiala viscosa]